jgi:hypothetical protein
VNEIQEWLTPMECIRKNVFSYGSSSLQFLYRSLLTMSIGHLSRVAQSVQSLATYWTNRRSGFDRRQRRKNFSSKLCVQISSGAHPAPCTMDTGGSFLMGKAWPGRDADHSPHLVPRSRMSRSYTSYFPKRLHGV